MLILIWNRHHCPRGGWWCSNSLSVVEPILSWPRPFENRLSSSLSLSFSGIATLSLCSNLILLRMMWEVDVRPWDWCQCWRCFVSWFHTNFRLRWFVDASSLICRSPSNGGIKFLGQPDVVGLCSVPTQSCTPMCGLCSSGYVYGVWLTFEEDGIPILNCSLCQWP